MSCRPASWQVWQVWNQSVWRVCRRSRIMLDLILKHKKTNHCVNETHIELLLNSWSCFLPVAPNRSRNDYTYRFIDVLWDPLSFLDKWFIISLKQLLFPAACLLAGQQDGGQIQEFHTLWDIWVNFSGESRSRWKEKKANRWRTVGSWWTRAHPV